MHARDPITHGQTTIQASLASARQKVGQLITQKMSAFSVQLIFDADNIRPIHHLDPNDIKFAKHCLLFLSELETLSSQLSAFSSFRFFSSKGLPITLYSLWRRTSVLNNQRLAFFQANAGKRRLVNPWLDEIHEIVIDKNEELKCFMANRFPSVVSQRISKLDDPAKIFLPAVAPGETELTDQDAIEPWHDALNKIRNAIKKLEDAVPSAKLEHVSFKPSGTYVIPNKEDLSEDEPARLINYNLRVLYNFVWGLNTLWLKNKQYDVSSVRKLLAFFKFFSLSSEKLQQSIGEDLRQSYHAILTEVAGLIHTKGDQLTNFIRFDLELKNHLKPGTIIEALRPAFTALQLHLLEHSIYIQNPVLTDSALACFDQKIAQHPPASMRERVEREEQKTTLEDERHKRGLRLSLDILHRYDLISLLNAAKASRKKPKENIAAKNYLAMIIAGIQQYPPEFALSVSHKLAGELAGSPEKIVALLTDLNHKITEPEDHLFCRELATQLLIAGFAEQHTINHDFNHILSFESNDEETQKASSERCISVMLTKVEINRFISMLNFAGSNASSAQALEAFFVLIHDSAVGAQRLHLLRTQPRIAIMEALLLYSRKADEPIKRQIAFFLAKLALHDEACRNMIFKPQPSRRSLYLSLLEQHCLQSPVFEKFYYEAWMKTQTITIRPQNRRYRFEVFLLENQIIIAGIHNHLNPTNKIGINAVLDTYKKNPRALCDLFFKFAHDHVSCDSQAEKKLFNLYAATLLFKENRIARLHVFQHYTNDHGHWHSSLLSPVKNDQQRKLFFNFLRDDLDHHANSILAGVLERWKIATRQPNVFSACQQKNIWQNIDRFKKLVIKFTSDNHKNNQKNPVFISQAYANMLHQRDNIFIAINAQVSLSQHYPHLKNTRDLLNSYVNDRKGSLLFLLNLSTMRRKKVLLAQNFLNKIDDHITKLGNSDRGIDANFTAEVLQLVEQLKQEHKNRKLEHRQDRLTQDIEKMLRESRAAQTLATCRDKNLPTHTWHRA